MTAIVRDHRTPAAQSHGPANTVVRDHRTQAPAPANRPVVRDHRTSGFDGSSRPANASGGVTVHSHPRPNGTSWFHKTVQALKHKLMNGLHINPKAVADLRSVAQPGIVPLQAGVPRPPAAIATSPVTAPPVSAPPFSAGRPDVAQFTGNVASMSNADLANTIANAPLFSAEDKAMMDKLPPEQQAMMTLQAKKQRESLMTSTLTNLMNMGHEMLKAIANNLRG